jgi:hypothetical protein
MCQALPRAPRTVDALVCVSHGERASASQLTAMKLVSRLHDAIEHAP